MATFSLGGEAFTLVTNKLTFAEARAFEKVTGYSFADLATNEQVGKSVASTQALIWISMKRVKPELKFTDLDGLPIDDIEWADDDEADAEDPTEAGSNTGPELSTTSD